MGRKKRGKSKMLQNCGFNKKKMLLVEADICIKTGKIVDEKGYCSSFNQVGE